MKLRKPGAEVFVPDGRAVGDALRRTTHMAVVAHPDDVEIVTLPAVLECFGREDRWLSGVVITDGAGSARSGPYVAFDDARMREVRRLEQRKAAVVGEYGTAVLLDYTSGELKATARADVEADVVSLLRAARPSVVFTHNLADRHDTHVAAALATIAACRALPPAERPQRLLGGEGWRDLDWMTEADAVVLDTSGRESLASALVGLFDSQIAGGKRYDRAVEGRRSAHATLRQSHRVDVGGSVCLAMDLTPLLRDDGLEPAAHVQSFLDRFSAEVADRVRRLRRV
jgi:LmbE family N-acetylglucosaminyl deacetylase